MTKLKCSKCKCNPEEIWMFGGFGIFPKDDKEYCETCFKKQIEFFQSHTLKQEECLEQIEIECNLIA